MYLWPRISTANFWPTKNNGKIWRKARASRTIFEKE